jgi:hypothetical protein
MPFVRIDALRADSDRLDALGRAVLDALVETIGVPATEEAAMRRCASGADLDGEAQR